MAFTDDSELYCWGGWNYGQLGVEGVTSNCSTSMLLDIREDWAMLSAGMYHTLGLTKQGQVYSWGGGYSPTS